MYTNCRIKRVRMSNPKSFTHPATVTSSLTTPPATVTSSLTPAVDWPTKIESAIQSRHLTRVEESIASAKDLLNTIERFCEEGGNLSFDVERNLFDAFIEDDYEGRLHLTTLRSTENTVVGLVFWREVPVDEMHQWVDWDVLTSSISDLRGLENKEDSSSDEDRLSLVPVREESLRWLYQASTRNLRQPLLSREISIEAASALRIRDAAGLEELAHRWIKIELLAVRKHFWGHKYGSLLLAIALYEAWHLNNSRAILHVAGGHSNVGAVRLYERFGFVHVPSGGVFRKPDRDLWVLSNIAAALQHLSWSECLAPKPQKLLIEEKPEKDAKK